MIARQYEQYGQRQGVAEVEPVESCRAALCSALGARAFYPFIQLRDPDPLNVFRGRKKMCNDVVSSAVEVLLGVLEDWEF